MTAPEPSSVVPGGPGSSPHDVHTCRVPLANGLELAVDDWGGDGPPVVLIMGLGAQRVHWPDGFCDLLFEQGFRVIRFDNRDVGESTRLPRDAFVSSPWPILFRRITRLPQPKLAFTLDDLAHDVALLLDALQIDRAHIVGASLGGMVAQLVALGEPSRVISLTSIMSTTGHIRDGLPTMGAIRALLRNPGKSREDYQENAILFHRAIGGVFPLDTQLVQAIAGVAHDRGPSPRGFLRQLAASLAARPRTRRLRSVTVPTLVIHGEIDPLVPLSGGLATADAIPCSELWMVPGMGHTLQRALWARLTTKIGSHLRRAATLSATARQGS